MSKRKASREWVMQKIYAHLVNHTEIQAAEIPANLDEAYIQRTLSGINSHQDTIAKSISTYISIPLEKIDTIELSILNLACYEIIYDNSIPVNVSINEATELCKRFGGAMSYKFINATLDAMVKGQQLSL
ncbi:MAG: transcription antitermination factor NusB [Legionellales bacterium]|nr:transcription antitermination factor NusB [Legionellales bacterium]|tara:strand:- start:596 stop:985 length:390 start_codon:yes stop_codon:yes gene_type:complete